MWKAPVAGLGWPVANGRVFTTAVEQKASRCAIVHDAHGKGRQVEVFKILPPRHQSEKQLGLAVGDRRRSPMSSAPTAALSQAGEIIWKNRFLPVVDGAGGSPIVYGDLVIQLRWRDAAFVIALTRTRANEVEDQSWIPSDHDAARHSRRRSGSAGQRRRVSRPRL